MGFFWKSLIFIGFLLLSLFGGYHLSYFSFRPLVISKFQFLFLFLRSLPGDLSFGILFIWKLHQLLSINDSVYSCVFFFLTGLHFFHLLFGLLLLSLLFWSCSFPVHSLVPFMLSLVSLSLSFLFLLHSI